MAGKIREALIATIGGADGTAFVANPGRTFLSFTNTHATQDLFVRFGTSAASATAGRKIAAGATVTWGDNTNRAVPGSEVHVFGSGGGTTFYAYEHDGELRS